MTAFSTWRDGVDSWVIHGVTDEGLEFDLPFFSEAARNECWQILEHEDMGDKFLYGNPLLGSSLERITADCRSLEVAELEAERA